MIFFYLLSSLTAVWVLETMARSSGVMESYRASRDAAKPKNEIGYEVYNYSRMSSIFLGRGGKVVTVIIISLFSYGALWAYVSVFSSSVTLIAWKYPFKKFGECSTNMADWSLWDNCHLTYLGSVVLFSMIVIPLSMIGVTEQAILQNILTFWRFFCFSIMAITCIIQIIYNIVHDEFNPIDDASEGTFKYFFNFSGFSSLFSAASVALSCHQNLPDVVTPTKSKKHLKLVLLGGITTATIIYIIIGYACTLTFGSNTKTPVTHNWMDYSGCNGGFGKCDDGDEYKWYGAVIQWLILLFPAINLMSEYPLVCCTLSSNLQQLIPHKYRHDHNKLFVYISRVCACVPPLIAGAIKGDLEVIFNFTGIFGFFLLFIIPSFLQVYSKYIIRRKWGSKTYVTPFTTKLSSSYIATPVLIIAVVCFSFSLVEFFCETIGII